MPDAVLVVQLALTGLAIGAIYALIGLGFTIIFNATDSINFAQGEFVMLGGVLATVFVRQLQWPLAVGCVAAVVAVTGIAALLEWLTIDRVRRLTVLTFVILTIGLSITIKAATRLAVGTDPMSYPTFSGERPLKVAGALVQPQALWIFAVTAAAVVGIYLFFQRTVTGKAMRAASYNAVGAGLVGINVRLMILMSFACSALLGAVAGVIITPVTFVMFDNGTIFGLKGFAAAVLGGLGSGLGAVLGGLLLGLLESLSAGLVSTHYKDVIAFVVLLLVLFVRPTGLFGARAIRKA
jgi:branched-chain amino acid transport system permease protein